MSDNNTAQNSGLGFFSILGIAFIVLKLMHVIEWPWIWVLAPIWIPTGFVMILIFTGVVIMLLKDKPKNDHDTK